MQGLGIPSFGQASGTGVRKVSWPTLSLSRLPRSLARFSVSPGLTSFSNRTATLATFHRPIPSARSDSLWRSAEWWRLRLKLD